MTVIYKKTIAIVLATIIMIPNICYADTITDKKSQLNQVSTEMKNKKDTIDDLNQKQSTVVTEINSLDNTIDEANNDLEELKVQIDNKKKDIIKVEQEVDEMKTLTDVLMEEKENRMVSLYKNGGLSTNNTILFFNAIFEGKSLISILNMLSVSKSIAENDVNLITESNKEMKTYTDKKKKLEQEKTELNKLMNSQVEKNNYLNTQMNKKTTYYSRLGQQKEYSQEMLNELAQTSQQLTTTIKRLQEENARKKQEEAAKKQQGNSGTSTTPVYSSGFARPTNGYVSSPYGWRIHPITGVRTFHSGVDLASNTGTPIYASKSGTVLLSGTNGGYGLCIVLDNGTDSNGTEWSTVYAHCSKLLVSSGQSVVKGQLIANVGSTGFSTGPHLHFEIRKNGETVNPLDYI